MPNNIQVACFTTTYNGLSLELSSKASIARSYRPSSATTPPNPQQFLAIWDTGATGSVITQKIVDDCGLQPTGMVNVETVGGTRQTPSYLVSLILPNRVVFPELRVVLGDVAGASDVLIGMDVICRGDFAVTNKDGKTVFTFRMPSVDCIDFIKQAPPGPNVVKVSRNAPCPCGSGKKLKRCCAK